MGRLFTLIVVAGLAYGGLYFYYGVVVKQAVAEQLDAYGLEALEVKRIDYEPLAPLRTQSTVTATLGYRGAEAGLMIRLDGHPIFSDEVRMELQGLQALRLTLGAGQ
ncbi:hypothetical protein [Halomonas sp. 328]|uniref:hypothetical protein n=1 Tax=Halomonas sp. 328 TaxID=2776704 RepID=UPI0018A75C47|nr:hypothetical protein [Halomonas sp. 328]MBF8222411.1 hypothetical protein [Halomonas sp. 328]